MRTISIPWIRRYFIDWHWTFPFTQVSWQQPEKEVVAEYECVIQHVQLVKHST